MKQEGLVAAAKLCILGAWDDSGIVNAHEFYAALKAGRSPLPMGADQIKRFSGPTLYRWRSIAAEARAKGVDPLVALAPGYKPVRGAGARALSDPVKQRIQELWGNTNRPTLAWVLDLVAEEFGERPNATTAGRYINSLPKKLITEMRYGHKKVNDRFTVYTPTDYEKYRAMEFVSSDHHCLDLLCAAEPSIGATGAFRPWITLFHDYRGLVQHDRPVWRSGGAQAR